MTFPFSLLMVSLKFVIPQTYCFRFQMAKCLKKIARGKFYFELMKWP